MTNDVIILQINLSDSVRVSMGSSIYVLKCTKKIICNCWKRLRFKSAELIKKFSMTIVNNFLQEDNIVYLLINEVSRING